LVRVLLLIGILLLVIAGATARTADIRVLSSAGLRVPMDAVRAQAESAIGRSLSIEYGGASGYKTKIEAGEPFDVAILTPEAVDALIKEGKSVAGSRVDVGGVGIAVGLRGDAPAPDISTPDKLKQAFLSAKSIRYAASGASRPTVDRMFDLLGIADAVRA